MNNTLTKNNIDTIEACRYCPMCRQACTTQFLSYKETDSPRGRAILLYNIYEGDKTFDIDTIESIYNCFLCGCCISWCEGYAEGHYNIPEIIKFARKDIVSKGLEPIDIKEMEKSIIAYDNRYGIGKMKSFSAKFKEKEADVLYYLGPEINFKNFEIAEAAIAIFNKLDINYTILKIEPDSGKILSLLGCQDESIRKAEELYERINKVNCKMIVTSDPIAYDAFKNDYHKFGFEMEPKFKIKSISEFLYDVVKERKIKFKNTNKKITLIDSEYFGRYNGIFEAPRYLIKLISDSNFIETKWNRNKMLATGESAFYFNTKSVDTGEKLGERIYQMAKDIEANLIITLSATAKNNLSKTIENKIKVSDISEFIAEFI